MELGLDWTLELKQIGPPDHGPVYGLVLGLDHGNAINRERGRRTHDTAEQKSLGAE